MAGEEELQKQIAEHREYCGAVLGQSQLKLLLWSSSPRPQHKAFSLLREVWTHGFRNQPPTHQDPAGMTGEQLELNTYHLLPGLTDPGSGVAQTWVRRSNKSQNRVILYFQQLELRFSGGPCRTGPT